MTGPDLEFVDARTIDDCEALVHLFDRVWDVGDGPSVIDGSTMMALAGSGNLVTSVYQDGVLVSGAVGWFGPPGAPLHSHVVGVDAARAGRGVGYAVKLHQRQWCLDRGVTRMTWTYDPLIARNAWFNASKLGALPVAYHPNHYGALRDPRNGEDPSDRLLVSWDLERSPGAWPLPAGDLAYVEVPSDIERLRRDDPAAASTWRHATRAAMTGLLADGWRVVGFDRESRYVFAKETV